MIAGSGGRVLNRVEVGVERLDVVVGRPAVDVVVALLPFVWAVGGLGVDPGGRVAELVTVVDGVEPGAGSPL